MGGGLHASGSMKNGDVGGADRLGSGDGRGWRRAWQVGHVSAWCACMGARGCRFVGKGMKAWRACMGFGQLTFNNTKNNKIKTNNKNKVDKRK